MLIGSIPISELDVPGDAILPAVRGPGKSDHPDLELVRGVEACALGSAECHTHWEQQQQFESCHLDYTIQIK